MKDNVTGSDFDETDFESQDIYEVKNEVSKETNRNRYYAVQTIANKFINVMVDGGAKSIYNMLDPTYIKDFEITERNAYQKLNVLAIGNLDEYQRDNLEVQFIVKEMYSIEKSSNIVICFLSGNIKSNVEEGKKEYSLIVEIDSKNNTFYILPEDYIKEKNYTDSSKFENYHTLLEEIPVNDYNKFNFTNIDDVNIIKDYLSYYKDIIAEDIEQSYDLLNEEYREARFDSKEEYKQYIKENIKDILSITITKYKTNQLDDYNEYICLDQNNNYYIFQETAIMDYKIMLDTYTLDTQEFLDKYKTGKPQTKVGMNVEKIVQALNMHDYKYIYNRLDQTFKENNFNTIDKFKEYMQEQYTECYGVEYYNVQEESGIYQQKIRLVPNNNIDGTLEKTIIMQLKEGTDFVMSFSI